MKRWFAMLLILGFAHVTQADNLGRLFTTPEQRMQLDRPPGARVAVAMPRITVQAWVQRHGGEPFVLLDGEAVRAGERARSGVRVITAGKSEVTLQAPGHAQPVHVSPGASLSLHAASDEAGR